MESLLEGMLCILEEVKVESVEVLQSCLLNLSEGTQQTIMTTLSCENSMVYATIEGTEIRVFCYTSKRTFVGLGCP